ncbi:hypothetical protein NC99_18570 [Sunxiuqinia dokdonensis]|uniref:AB hydrolase-1 domain-containing protein n=2 Tax=Sunxiuqinia dokdonensis TaxID=1409788 RepID=A0A0L8VA76_9BACT|nr:hypothetical protein NC99_18570 [Sunxiuqinia dokdonensis]
MPAKIRKHKAMNTFFNGLDTRKEMIRMYYQKLDKLPISYEQKMIETTFGDTNLVITGPEGKPPLVLLHDTNSCAPLALESMVELTYHFRVYAIDVLGQPNLSEELRLNMKDNTYGKWMYEILSRFGLQNTSLVGISRGGFIALKTLIFDEKRIARTFLITPEGIVNGNPLQLFMKVILPLKMYRATKSTKYLNWFLEEFYTEENEFSKAFLSNVYLHYKIDLSKAPLIRKKEALQIKTPVHIIAAEKDLLFPGKKLIKRANTIFPLLSEVVLLRNSKHILSKQDNRKTTELIRNSIWL